MSGTVRQKIKQALLELPKKDKKVFDGLSGGKDQELVAIDARAYEPVIGMLQYNDAQRKKQ